MAGLDFKKGWAFLRVRWHLLAALVFGFGLILAALSPIICWTETQQKIVGCRYGCQRVSGYDDHGQLVFYECNGEPFYEHLKEKGCDITEDIQVRRCLSGESTIINGPDSKNCGDAFELNV